MRLYGKWSIFYHLLVYLKCFQDDVFGSHESQLPGNSSTLNDDCKLIHIPLDIDGLSIIECREHENLGKRVDALIKVRKNMSN